MGALQSPNHPEAPTEPAPIYYTEFPVENEMSWIKDSDRLVWRWEDTIVV